MAEERSTDNFDIQESKDEHNSSGFSNLIAGGLTTVALILSKTIADRKAEKPVDEYDESMESDNYNVQDCRAHRNIQNK
ncbi:MAG: hypothetical protein FJ161_03005 [Gammaproteobacteria bacterium]|nr:hypothetical protein [Gammaproteobacteria bacterium]